MSGQGMEKALDVGFEDAVDDGIVRLVEVLPKSVPEVKGNFYHLFGEKTVVTNTIISPLCSLDDP